MTFTYKTKGVCSSKIDIETDGNKIKDVKFTGGCNGNTKGISSIVKGMDIDEVISRCEGITCGPRGTSCPDQLAEALKQLKVQTNK